ncbi:MAG TPA: sodium:proton antiporter [Pirellulales bacterium]|nr:sodium:proton antiporter [Pirellulales bacterium]
MGITDDSSTSPSSSRGVVITTTVILVGYLVAAALGLPQRGTELTLGEPDYPVGDPSVVTLDTVNAPEQPGIANDSPPADLAQRPHVPAEPPSFLMVLPFALLLAAIAVLPLSHWTEHWWDNNLHRFYVAAGLGLFTLGYYALVHAHPVDRHFLGHAVIAPSSGGVSLGVPWAVFQNAIFNEFVPFVILLFALYTISGGIRIEGDLPAHPLTNSLFIGVGAVLANLIGTTGAAMLLVRPLLETNSERRHVKHTVVFFIFAVCNCGGCLLPIGDPPLFLGYLQGVDFLWTLALWPPWLLVNGALVVIYYAWDYFWCYPHEAKADLVKDEARVRRLQFSGVWPNALLLLAVVVAVAILDPSKPFPGSDWHPWLFLREAVLLALVGLSLVLGRADVRRANQFNYGAIIEVAALFFGIFLCMQPALQILEVKGNELGIDVPWKFFWSTGALSSVLDNAPTYLVFFKAAQSLHSTGETMAGVNVDILAAISLGAVFMGAMTYIGNGPNFMVKSIAEKAGVKMPSFFGYMLYSLGVLFPLFVIVTLVFFR